MKIIHYTLVGAMIFSTCTHTMPALEKTTHTNTNIDIATDVGFNNRNNNNNQTIENKDRNSTFGEYMQSASSYLFSTDAALSTIAVTAAAGAGYLAYSFWGIEAGILASGISGISTHRALDYCCTESVEEVIEETIKYVNSEVTTRVEEVIEDNEVQGYRSLPRIWEENPKCIHSRSYTQRKPLLNTLATFFKNGYFVKESIYKKKI